MEYLNKAQETADLGQDQLELGLDLTSSNLHWIARKLVLLYMVSYLLLAAASGS